MENEVISCLQKVIRRRGPTLMADKKTYACFHNRKIPHNMQLTQDFQYQMRKNKTVKIQGYCEYKTIHNPSSKLLQAKWTSEKQLCRRASNEG